MPTIKPPTVNNAHPLWQSGSAHRGPALSNEKSLTAQVKKFIWPLGALLWLLLGPAFPALAASPFETDEYKASTGLPSLEAAKAYELGFTGQGVTVGVVDSLFAPDKFEFAGKYPYGQFLSAAKSVETHGIQVSGIIAAAKNNAGMHGLAFNATLLPFQTDWGRPGSAFNNVIHGNSLFAAILPAWEKIIQDYPQVKIINNSTGLDYFLDGENYSSGFIENTLQADPGWQYFLDVAQKAVAVDKLLILSSGNEGHLSPNLSAGLPTVVSEKWSRSAEGRALSLNWISAAAFDSSVFDNPALGVSSPAFVADFTNMGQGASAYTLWAPGVKINTTNSPDTYSADSGTSFAAPYISGVAALTQSAFPYMGGKQLADVLLSTATPFTNPGVDTPNIFLLYRKTFAFNDNDGKDNPSDDPASTDFHLYYPESYINGDITMDILETEHHADTEALIRVIMEENTTKDHNTTYDEARDLLGEIIDNGAFTIFTTDAEYLELFGAGIVNAYRAVQGPGFFDANRLDPVRDLVAAGAYGPNAYAMYSVDSQGYDSVWSNNIGQRPATESNSLNGLGVGLRKQGAGMLYLTGNNEYAGPTVVAGGGISLGRTGQNNSDAKLAGSVYIEEAGLFTGNGTVAGNLTSKGVLFPGFSDRPGTLTIGGDATSTGEFRLHLWPDSANKLAVVGSVNLDGTTVSINSMDGGGPVPDASWNYEVITAASLSGTLANADNTATALQGVTLLHNFNLDMSSGHSLSAAYQNSSASPRAKALSEGFLGGVTLVNQGADALAGPGLESAVSSAREARAASDPQAEEGYSPAAFGAVYGGSIRNHSGSHVDMGSFSLMTGLSKGLAATPGRLTIGAFFEYGNGDYDTYNAFSNAADVHGDGDVRYIGGGLLAHMDFDKTGSGHFYTEAAGRAGEVHNEYNGRDLRDGSGRMAAYETSSPYYGLHLGTGYIWDVTNLASLNLYGKYFWTHQQGAAVTLSTNDPVVFNSVDSHRLRLGSRLSSAGGQALKPYLGAAYEHEFDSRARATTHGIALDTPSMRGGTGIGEAGLTFTPSEGLPLYLDLGLQGYTGKREGLTGSLQLKLEF